MSKLNVDQRTIKDLFQDKKSDFLIPDYQRPYAWEETECQTLWDDIFAFAIPEEGQKDFDSSQEYFLGPIVTFKNNEKEGKIEVIDGQQRLTTLMLLLRAFYAKFDHMKDKNSLLTRQDIEKCIWKTDEFGTPYMDQLKIDSEVATDDDKDEFMEILRTGKVTDDQKSRYADNYRFFQKSINNFLNDYPTYFANLPVRIMNNCILLPIEAESQDTALRIFSTLNDRGIPLSDSDIFKAQFYNFYSTIGKKDSFIEQWKALEELCSKIFHPLQGTPMDELFTRYMYYVRAKEGIKNTTTEGLRKFYEGGGGYPLLKKEETFNNLVVLAKFWSDVLNQEEDFFSIPILRKLCVLNFAPNGMWAYIVSVYYMQNRREDGSLDEEAFGKFLDKITGFIWTYAVMNPGVNALRTPVYAEMVNIVNDEPVEFADFKFDAEEVRNKFSNYSFTNVRQMTKSMLAWWAFTDDNQELLNLETPYEVEHIYAKNRQEKESALQNPKNLEAIGNKALLEKKINIRAADYRFEDKKRYYKGYTTNQGKKKEGTHIYELLKLADEVNDFTEDDIIKRTDDIIDQFIQFLNDNNLIVD